MSQTAPSPEESPQGPPEGHAKGEKLSYHPPEVRELGHLAELTGTGPSGSSYDTGTGYAS
jgi:hypothetical protein